MASIGSGNFGNLKNKPGTLGKDILSARTQKETSTVSREINDAQENSGVVGCIPKKHNILNDFPKWIRDRDSDSNFIEFVQKYYDWVYCKGNSGSQYYVDSSDFLNLLNLENISIDVLKSYASSYAADFPQNKIGNIDGNQGVTKENFVKFLDGVKNNFYITKGSEFSYRYFFNTLYGKTLDDNSIDYPKKKILRLNGGRFSSWRGTTGSYESVGSLGGSYLGDNYALQDNYFYQEYSYLTKIGIDSSYSDILLEILHPMGLQPFFEQTFTSYEPIGGSGDYSEGIVNDESPRLGNYLPYQIDATGDVAPCVGCSGSGASNTYFETQRGISAPTYDIPTFNHPGWALAGGTTETVGDIDKYDLSFSGVVIGSFLDLTPPSGISNPNDGITTCDNQTCVGP